MPMVLPTKRPRSDGVSTPRGKASAANRIAMPTPSTTRKTNHAKRTGVFVTIISRYPRAPARPRNQDLPGRGDANVVRSTDARVCGANRDRSSCTTDPKGSRRMRPRTCENRGRFSAAHPITGFQACRTIRNMCSTTVRPSSAGRRDCPRCRGQARRSRVRQAPSCPAR